MKTPLSLLLAVALAPAVLAQTPSSTQVLLGTTFEENVGRSVANAGDVDLDGFDDIILGADHDSGSGRRQAGRVEVRSGATNAVLYSWSGGFTGDFLGCAVDGAGDLDGDGYPDVVYGAYGRDKLDQAPYYNEAGSVYARSGRTGNLLFRFDAWDFPAWVRDGARFGYSVAGAGDVNADGFDDIVVGAYVGFRPANPGEGVAVVISGRSHEGWTAANPTPPIVLHTFYGNAAQQFLGFSVDGAGDVDRDGYDDLIVGVVGANSFSGGANIYSGFDGSVLHALAAPAQPGHPSTNAPFFGGSVSGAGDIDRDGHADVVVGLVFDNTAGPDFGGAVVFSGQTGAQLQQFTGMNSNSLYGFAVSGGGDVDGDGHPDVAVGAVLDSGSGSVNGAVHVFRGNVVPEQLLATFNGPQLGGAYGFSVALGGDHDGDGYAEILTGSPFHDAVFGQANDEGIVDLLDVGQTGTPARVRQVGPGCASGQGSMPRITVYGKPALGAQFELLLRGAQPGKYWVLNMGAALNAPAGADLTGVGMPGCFAYATANGFILSDSSNMTDPVHGMVRYSLPAPIPNLPAFVGQSIYAQFIVVDNAPAANGAALVTSNGIELTFGN